MGVQKTYSYNTSYGVAGGLVDLTEHVIDSRCNEATTLKLGCGVVDGSTKGANVKLPVEASTKADFEGVVVNSHSHEMDMNGEVKVAKGETVNVLKQGRIFARIKAGITVAYGDALYLIVKGDNAGLFTNAAVTGETVKLNGFFVGAKATGDIAPVQVYVDKVNEATASKD